MDKVTNKSSQKITNHWVDQQLMASGTFNPLYALLDAGFLAYADYENWRSEQLESLDGVLGKERPELIEFLQQCADYAKRFDLIAEAQTYYVWKQQTSTSLVISHSAVLAKLLGQVWRRPENIMQLDMFLDNAAVVTENKLCHACANQLWTEAAQLYSQLVNIAPQHPSLSQYEGLIAYGQHTEANPQIAAAALENELNGLETEVQPLAKEILAAQSRDYLAPAWKRVAQSLAAIPFDPQQPKLHESYAWAQLGAWPQVMETITSVPNWQNFFALVERAALAFYHQRKPELALLYAATLPLLNFEQAEIWLRAEAQFQAVQDSLQSIQDEETTLSIDYFPAYFLLQQPRLTHFMKNAPALFVNAPATRAVIELLEAKAAGNDEVQARRNLQQISPVLFESYIKGV